MTDITFRPTVNPSKAAHRILMAQENVDPGPLANNEHARGKLPVDQTSYITPRAIDDHYSGARVDYARDYLSKTGSDAARVARLNRGLKDMVYKSRYVPRYGGSILFPYNEQYTNTDPSTVGSMPNYDTDQTIQTYPSN